MIRPGPGTRIWLACGFTDMRRGFDGLAALVQSQLEQDPFSGQLFVFRGRKGDRVCSPFTSALGRPTTLFPDNCHYRK